MGRAVHRGEVKCRTAWVVALAQRMIAIAVMIVTSVGVQSMRTREQRSATAT